MARPTFFSSWVALSSALYLAFIIAGVNCGTLKVVNRCPYTVWPAIQTTSGGHEVLSGGGFTLGAGQSTTLSNVPNSWSGRLWGRSGCNFNSQGAGSCSTGDCHNGLKCNGNGYTTPVTLAEFTLGGWMGLTFYDVSAVDGFNVPLSISPTHGANRNRNDYSCGSPSCIADVNGQCPAALQLRSGGRVVACKSGCVAFQQPQYCCTGAYNDPKKCPPTNYSKFFKNLCPTAYSYAYDDPTSTFTCNVVDFTITFCSTMLLEDTLWTTAALGRHADQPQNRIQAE